MANLLEQFENKQLAKLSEGKKFPSFKAGDTLCVKVRIAEAGAGEGAADRIQAFEGVCIHIKNRGLNSAFTVRKISHGEGVERVFPLYSPRIESIEVVRRGEVNRAKLYYMRNLTGKAARIREKREVQVVTTADGGATNTVPAASAEAKPKKAKAATAKKSSADKA